MDKHVTLSRRQHEVLHHVSNGEPFEEVGAGTRASDGHGELVHEGNPIGAEGAFDRACGGDCDAA